MTIRICRLSDLPDPGSRGFELGKGEERRSCVLIRRGNAVWAYENRCPHTGAPLDWRPGQVLSPEGTHIQCALHLAQFRMEDGLCIHGPCVGQSLRAVEVRCEGAWVVLAYQNGAASTSSEEADE
ncbi:MAG TPA: Rieske (2Fe-2S) protein [Candidatus Acidoferrales bacterium]|nr:Rieske (2Fe-2S) protein [Candidatus Acidoferrales bacterium]